MTLAVTSLVSFRQQAKNKEKLILEKGTWVIGGSLGLNYGNSEYSRPPYTGKTYGNESETAYFTFQPKSGYMIKNNMEVGLGLPTTKSTKKCKKESSEPYEEKHTSSLAIAPHLKGYKSLNKNLALSLKGEIGYSKNSQDGETFNTTISYSGSGHKFNVALRPASPIF